ncbi:hypothetical protein [Streptomyces sp. enrichment culture]|uniref:hypothetical protein n=1 Tax=Streptomyces sp. enrichment culture TaxID=1795815 RepID=UPI003F57CE5B
MGLRGAVAAPVRAGRRRLDARTVLDKQVCKRCNVVERCFDRLKQWRGTATRHGRAAESCRAAVTLASLLMRA